MSSSRYVTENVYMNEIYSIGGHLNSFQESDGISLLTMVGNMKRKNMTNIRVMLKGLTY